MFFNSIWRRKERLQRTQNKQKVGNPNNEIKAPKQSENSVKKKKKLMGMDKINDPAHEANWGSRKGWFTDAIFQKQNNFHNNDCRKLKDATLQRT